jgi:hypothetical protein
MFSAFGFATTTERIPHAADLPKTEKYET